MHFYRRHWYDVGCILFLTLAFTAGYWGQKVSHIQAILIYSFMALLVHQYEEYAAPGGFPGIFNIAVLGEREVPSSFAVLLEPSLFRAGSVSLVCLHGARLV
jgi:hypothetical protein